MNAKPPAMVKANTTPSTGPSKCLRASSRISSRPRDLANSSTTGAWTVAINVWKSATSLNWKVRAKNGWISSVTAMDTAAPQVNAKNRSRLGSGSHRSIR